MVYVDNPSISAKVRVMYATYYHKLANGSDQGDPNLGDKDIKAVVIDTSLTGGSQNDFHHYLLVLGGDARLTKMDLSEVSSTWRANKISIKYRGVSARVDIQAFELSRPASDASGYGQTLAGYLTTRVVDTGSGRTLIRIPSMGSAAESAQQLGEINEQLKPQDVWVSGKKWYLPKTVKYMADVGVLTVGTDIDDARPVVDTTDPNRLRWSAKSIDVPQALLSNNVSVQRATQELFAAGIMAGLAGGLLVDGVSRIRLGKRKEREATSDAKPATSLPSTSGGTVAHKKRSARQEGDGAK
jgi:hypothetical protein